MVVKTQQHGLSKALVDIPDAPGASHAMTTCFWRQRRHGSHGVLVAFPSPPPGRGAPQDRMRALLR